MRTKTSDGRKKKDYSNKIVVRLNDEQLAHIRHHFGWLGNDDYVGYFLIVSAIHDRPYAGPLTEKVKRAVARSQIKNPWTKRDDRSGKFMDVKADPKPFKGARKGKGRQQQEALDG